MKLVNPVQAIVTNFYIFYQACFAKGIGYHIADFYILEDIVRGIVV